MLSYEEARQVYDQFGARQDDQDWYEDPATDVLVRHGDLQNAHRIMELGCGTGRFAQRILREVLPGDATYLGLDISETMIGLARQKLGSLGSRVQIAQVEGPPLLPVESESMDAFICNYVLDLLSLEDIRRVLDEAHRVLVPGGRLLTSGLTHGSGLLASCTSGLWTLVHRFRPRWVGGCRPLRLVEELDPSKWDLIHHEVVQVRTLASEALIATRR